MQLTGPELVWIVPVEGHILDGLVGDPDQRLARQRQLAGQVDVVATRHPDLADAHGGEDAQRLLLGSTGCFTRFQATKQCGLVAQRVRG